MPQGDTERSGDLRAATAAIVDFLRGNWPNAVHITPATLALPMTDSRFLEAALVLQDEGAMMYEAMLVGVDARPCLRYAILTRKGQLGSGAVTP